MKTKAQTIMSILSAVTIAGTLLFSPSNADALCSTKGKVVKIYHTKKMIEFKKGKVAVSIQPKQDGLPALRYYYFTTQSPVLQRILLSAQAGNVTVDIVGDFASCKKYKTITRGGDILSAATMTQY